MSLSNHTDYGLINRISLIDKALAEVFAEFSKLKDELMTERIASVNELTERAVTKQAPIEVEGYPYKVVLNKGREARKWDDAGLYPNLGPEMREVAYQLIPKGDAKILNTLAEQGKIAAELVSQYLIVTPANPRWEFRDK